MGLGGHLLWSSVIRTLNEISRQPVAVGYTPMLSDIIAGRRFDEARSLADDEIFRHNPRIAFPRAARKSAAQRQADRGFQSLLHRAGLRRAYERMIFRAAQSRAARGEPYQVHVDMALHRYVKRETAERLEWREGGHIIDIIASDFGVKSIDHRCELHFTDDEVAASSADRQRLGLSGDYIVVEPNSRPDWFGDLRAWPFDRWQQLIDAIHGSIGCRVVQVGEKGSRPLAGVLDVTGQLPFRRSALLMKQARLFIGQEGGLNHTANAVGVPAVMIWGGLTVPEFAAYREFHTVICAYVDCAPCGLRGGCPYDKKCLTSVAVLDVLAAVRAALGAPPDGIDIVAHAVPGAPGQAH